MQRHFTLAQLIRASISPRPLATGPQLGGKMSKQLIRVLCLLSVLSLNALPAMAQARSSSADITGTVFSPSKSVIPEAHITATNLATGLIRTVTTDSAGNYRIPLLPPGQYDLKVEVAGYNSQIRKGITLTVGQIALINFEMALGVIGVVETIDIDA